MSSHKRISLPVGNQHVEDLLLWRDPKKSGVVFAGISLLYILLEWTGLSLLTIIANSLLVLVSLSFLCNNIASFAGRPGVPVPETFRSGVSERQVKSYAEFATIYLNKALGFINRVITGKEVVLSGQVALALFLVGKVGSWFTSLGLLYTVLLLAFTIPKAYELRKDEIDHMFHKAQHHGKQNYNKYVEPYLNKIPRASTSTTSTPGRRTGTAYDSTAESSGMGQPNMGMGQSNMGMGQSHTGMGQSNMGMGQSNTGMGQPQGGMGQSGMGMGQSHTGMGQSNMGMGQPQGGMGQSNMGMGQGGLGQSNVGMGQGGLGQSSMPMGQAQGGGVDPNGGFTVTHTTTTKKAL